MRRNAVTLIHQPASPRTARSQSNLLRFNNLQHTSNTPEISVTRVTRLLHSLGSVKKTTAQTSACEDLLENGRFCFLQAGFQASIVTNQSETSELDTSPNSLSYCLFVMSVQVVTAKTASATDAAWAAIRGAYDLQVHVAPDVIERRIDDIGLAEEFLARDLQGFVLKSHYFPTAERAKVVSRAVPGIQAFGAIVLNHAIGGLNPVAVELAGRSGAKIVWMPTVDAANETAGRLDGPATKLPFWAKIQRELAATGIAPPPLTVLDENGGVNEATRSCLELIAHHNMILATGHLGRREIFALVRTAREMKLKRVLVTHAEFPSQNLNAEEQLDLANMGAFIEHCFTTMHTGKAPWETVLDSIRRVGPERCLISTDLGQTINPPVSDGFAMFAQTLLDAGFSVEEIRRMGVTNPSALIE